MEQPSIHHYAAAGACINRINDRLFIGDAAKNDANQVWAQDDWLTTFQLSTGRVFGFLQVAQTAILTNENSIVGNALVVGAQTKNLLAGNAVGTINVAVNNNPTNVTLAYAGYYEAFRMAGSVGGATGVEVDTVSYEPLAAIDPYKQAVGQVVGIQGAAGAELPTEGQKPSSAFINIRNNGATFDKGIVFGHNSLSGANGLTGTATAIAFGKGHAMQWYGGENIKTSSIVAYGTTFEGSATQRFNDGSIGWFNSNNKLINQIVYSDSNVNYLSLRASNSAAPTQIVAWGDDANVDLQIVNKGTGKVWLGSYLANAPAATGYITVKDSTGNVRKLLCA